ncbi:hypothetical protein VTG60DRAFT_4329 [Thermothelomyces hinnuleus]
MTDRKSSEDAGHAAGMNRGSGGAGNSSASRRVSLPADFAPSPSTSGNHPAARRVGARVDSAGHARQPTRPEQQPSAPRPPTGTTSPSADRNGWTLRTTTEHRRLHITPVVFRSRRVRCTRFSRYRGSRPPALPHDSPVEEWSPDSDDWEDVRTSNQRARSATPKRATEGEESSDPSDRVGIHPSIYHARSVARRRIADQSGRRYSGNDSPRTNPRITDSIAPSPINQSSASSEEGGRNADDEAVDDVVYDGPPEHPADRRASQASNPRLHLALQRPMPTALMNRTAAERATAAAPSIAEAANRAAAALASASPQRSKTAAVSNSNLPPGVVRAIGPNTRNHGYRISSGHTRKNKRVKDGSLSVHLRWRPDGYVTLSEGSSTNTTPGMLTPLPRDDHPQHHEQQQQQQQEQQQEVLRLGPGVREPSPPPPRRPSGQEEKPEDKEEEEEEEKGKIPYQDGDVYYP